MKKLLFVLVLGAAVAGCALLSSLTRVAGPLACNALVEVRDPETHGVLAALCPLAAEVLANLLAEDAASGGNGGRARARRGTCGAVPVSEIEPGASGHYCADRLGGASEAAALHARLMTRLAAADGGAR